MAYYEKTPEGTYRFHVKRKGYARRSKTFKRKSDGEKWARTQEAKMDTGDDLPSVAKETVEALVRRRIKEGISKWDELRLEAFLQQAGPLCKKPAARATHEDFERWVEKRKKEVTEQTALRELNVISGVFTRAIKHWKVKLPRHPTRGMIKPKKGKPRTRRPNVEELKVLFECRGSANQFTLKWYILWMFELAIETAMRIGEMVLIKPGDLHLDEHWLHLPKTKNGDARDVPLSPRAVEILQLVMQRPDAQKKGPFPLNKGSLDSTWRDICKDLGIVDLHFHDSRHEACTRLAKVYTVMDLAKISGHRDLKSLMIYYNPTPQELARRLRPDASATTPEPPQPPTTAS
jgi:integrase